MKKQITLNLAALLLGTTMLFTSCTKEILQSPEESQMGNSMNGANVSSNSTTPILLWSPYFAKVKPFTSKFGTSLTAIVTGKNVGFELYTRPRGSQFSPSLVCSIYGTEYQAAIVFQCNLEQEYFFRISLPEYYIAWPSMEELTLSTLYRITMTKPTKVDPRVVGFMINPT